MAEQTLPALATATLDGPRCKCGHLRIFHGAKGCEVERLERVAHKHTFTKHRCGCRARRKHG